ncbi:MAG: heterodisulfide reductase [Candidatus Neomarinimicrobiota bacterium]|nr:MAG: heterodisulfide reductase [Candidatus Neomarinimicrobiota bacterium]
MANKIIIDDSTVAFFNLISELSGETITLCDQCGTCSGGCPFVNDMDLMPSQLMRKTLLGQEDVLESKTMWLCATCNTCTVRCPRGLDVSKVAEALRQVKLRQSLDKIKLNEISDEELKELPPIAIIAANRKLVS